MIAGERTKKRKPQAKQTIEGLGPMRTLTGAISVNGLLLICAGPTKMVSALAFEISGHEARALVDERFHSIVGQHFGMVQYRVMRQRLDCGDTYK